jgi:surface protein
MIFQNGITFDGNVTIQYEPPPVFGFTYANTNTANLELTFFGVGNTTVDWGDGNTIVYSGNSNTVSITHNYANIGTYTSKITSNNLSSWKVIDDNVISLNEWGTDPATFGFGFSNFFDNGAPNLVSVPNYLPSTITSMYASFCRCTNFNDANVESWDTKNVTFMFQTFFDAANFNANISSWNTGNVNSMLGMFGGATNFNQPIGNWNTSSLTGNASMDGMFGGATAFNQDIGNWNVSNVTSIQGLFSYGSFNQPIGNWDVGNVTDMSGLFDNAPFNQDIGNWNVSNVLDMSFVFSGAQNFNQDISNWDTGNVTSTFAMFNVATSFNQDISIWDVSNVNIMDTMFNNATNFNQDLSPWITGLTTQPSNFSTGANATFADNASNLKPFLSDGTTRINT